MTTKEIDSEGEAGGLTILGALAQLRDDIEKLQEQNSQKGRAPLFLIEEGELELKLIAKRDVKAEGKGQAKFRLWVVDVEAGAGGSGSSSTERFQTLKIKFKGLAPKSAETATGMSFGYSTPSPQKSPTFKVDIP
jgi:hypothetical protein